MPREYYEGTWQKERAYSPVVVTTGGRVAWLAGDGGIAESDEELTGQSVELEKMQFALDFDTQVHNTFKRLRATLAKVGGELKDIVTMTVFIRDGRDEANELSLKSLFKRCSGVVNCSSHEESPSCLENGRRLCVEGVQVLS